MSIQLFIPSISSDSIVLHSRSPNELSGSDTLLFTATDRIYSGECAEIYRGVITGGTGDLDGKDIVCKLVCGGLYEVQLLAHEAQIYQSKLQHLQGRIVPTCYGYFEGDISQKGRTGCLVLEYAGEVLEGLFSDYEWSFRDEILKALVDIHKAGVAHCHVREPNVLQSPAGAPIIIDFKIAKEETCKMPSDFVFQPLIIAPDMMETGCPELCTKAVDLGIWKPNTMVHWEGDVSTDYLDDPVALGALSPDDCSAVEALDSAFTSIDEHYRLYYPEVYDAYHTELGKAKGIFSQARLSSNSRVRRRSNPVRGFNHPKASDYAWGTVCWDPKEVGDMCSNDGGERFRSSVNEGRGVFELGGVWMKPCGATLASSNKFQVTEVSSELLWRARRPLSMTSVELYKLHNNIST
ncbi:hypothetical protein OF83DRAFT_31350 [Amylostereum chailletii]|nr:hypothetical protein OF83DRAFT_31350 [Amylostereum chailletii]